MNIITATKNYSEEISTLMLADLANPDPRFPSKMIEQFREHAQKENISKEFDNLHLMAFLAIDINKLKGFIVGYEEKSNTVAVIHYIHGETMIIKKILLKHFISECKRRKIAHIRADSFEFMANDALFKEEKFILVKKEKIAKNLELLWYELLNRGPL